jgi:hypothetical protein
MTVTCCVSGKKRSGKNTSANYIAGRYLLHTKQITDFVITDHGLLRYQMRINGNVDWMTIEENDFNSAPFKWIKIYSFADPLKEFCMNVFGLTYEQCYGTEQQKNSYTKLKWENMPSEASFETQNDSLYGFMKAREVLQYFGTEIVRQMCNNAWVNATVNKISQENPQLALITDARFPNEIDGITEVGGITIRLLRNVAGADEHPSETALDNYPLDKYSFVLDNTEHTIEKQCEMLDPIIDEIFKI